MLCLFGLQVVVLRVSLHCHCRGCEGKVKKHLSKMQGESSVFTVLPSIVTVFYVFLPTTTNIHILLRLVIVLLLV